jgi:acyl-coenzyme A synthetase/AMP-(fatty) acid ligase
MSAPGYKEIYPSFRWEIPSTFNFAVDVVDYWAKNGDGDALVWRNAEGRHLDFRYSDMARLSNRFGAVLQSRGIAKGDRVVVMLPRSPEWMIAMVGVLRIGAIPVPCIEMLTARDVAYRVLNSEARAIVCKGEQTHKFADVKGTADIRIAVNAGQGWVDYATAMKQATDDPVSAEMLAEDPAIMYYTSGSTGHPKGVLHSVRALYTWKYSAIYWLDLKRSDIIWCTADTGWSKAGTSILFGPWGCGATTFLYDGPFEPKERLRLIVDCGVTVYCAPGAELCRVAEENMEGLKSSRLRRTVSAGEAVSPAIATSWESATGFEIYEGYGQTETLILAYNMPGAPVRRGSMGRPALGSDLAVIDENGRRLPPGETGDLALLMPNPQMMLGYWRDPERTAGCFRIGAEETWYITGDRAKADDDGYLWFQGRADDLINSAGYRIGPLEVENVLMEHPAVDGCAVVGIPDPERGAIVKAFVVLRAGFSPSDALKAELQAYAKSATAPYKYPRAIEFIAALPMTPTGKVHRRALQDCGWPPEG